MASKDQIYVLIDQAVVSASNFLCQFIIARSLGPYSYGQFSLVFLTSLFLSNLHRSFFTQPYNIIAATASESSVMIHRGALAVLHAPWVLIGGTVIATCGIGLGVSTIDAAAAALFFFFFQFHEFARRVALTNSDVRHVTINDMLTYSLQLCLVAAYHYFSVAPAVSTYLYLMGLAYFISAAVWFVQGFRLRLPTLKVVGEKARQHWQFGRWLFWSVFVTWGASQLYPFMLTKYGAAAVGAYVAARNIVNVTNLPIQAVNSYLPSVLTRHFANAEWDTVQAIMARTTLSLGAFAVLLLAAAFLFGDFLVHLIYGNQYAEAGALLKVLAVGGAFSVTSVMQNSILIAVEKTRGIFIGNLWAALFSLTVGLVLVFQLGALGAAIGAGTALMINSVIQTRKAGFELANLRRMIQRK